MQPWRVTARPTRTFRGQWRDTLSHTLSRLTVCDGVGYGAGAASGGEISLKYGHPYKV